MAEVSTHWHCCYRSHIDCANVEIERLRRALRVLVTVIENELNDGQQTNLEYDAARAHIDGSSASNGPTSASEAK